MNFYDFSGDQMSFMGSGCWWELPRISVVFNLVVSLSTNLAVHLAECFTWIQISLRCGSDSCLNVRFAIVASIHYQCGSSKRQRLCWHPRLHQLWNYSSDLNWSIDKHNSLSSLIKSNLWTVVGCGYAWDFSVRWPSHLVVQLLGPPPFRHSAD